MILENYYLTQINEAVKRAMSNYYPDVEIGIPISITTRQEDSIYIVYEDQTNREGMPMSAFILDTNELTVEDDIETATGWADIGVKAKEQLKEIKNKESKMAADILAIVLDAAFVYLVDKDTLFPEKA